MSGNDHHICDLVGSRISLCYKTSLRILTGGKFIDSSKARICKAPISYLRHHKTSTLKATKAFRQTHQRTETRLRLPLSTQDGIALAAGLLVANTPIHAYICGKGASALNFVKVVGINVATVICNVNGLPSNFAAGQSPKDPNDPAKAYFAQLEAHGKCSVSSPCTALCAVELTEVSFEGLSTLLGEQKRSCEAAGGTYKSIIM